MSDETAAATPLLDLLDNIPADARLSYEHSPTHHQMIPVGGLASAAAFRIRELEAERDALRAAIQKARESWASEGDGDLVWFVFDAALAARTEGEG